MAGKDDKWSLFRNFMYNELHITKEDIRQWISDACREQAELLVKQTFNTFNIKTMIEKAVLNKDWYGSQKEFTYDVKNILAKLLVEKINIQVKE